MFFELHVPRGPRSIPTCALSLALVVVGTAALGASSGSGAQPQLEVQTLANEGVALSDGRQTVLIDALFDQGVRGYRTLDGATRARLVEGELGLPPVALVFATHVHRDHFDADVVVEFLLRHTEARFISTPQSVAALRSAMRARGPLPAVERRVHGLLPDEGTTLPLDRAVLGDFDGAVTLLNLHHGRGGDPPTENLGILVEMAGTRALHIGDTEVRLDDVRALPWTELDIDVGLFPSWFLVKSPYLEVTRAIGAEHLVALHVPAQDAPASYFWPSRSLDGLADAIHSEFPDALVALRPGQRRSYSSARSSSK